MGQARSFLQGHDGCQARGAQPNLQRLAIARARPNSGLEHSACYLYKNTDKVVPKGKEAKLILFKEKHPDGAQAYSNQFDFFAWFVDCFPVSSAHSKNDPPRRIDLLGSVRCTQIVMKYLIDQTPADHFIAEYLRFRYRARQ